MTTLWTHRLALALTVSVALNLFLAGAFVGGWITRDGAGLHPAAGGPAPDYSVAEFIRALPPGALAEAERAVGARSGDVGSRIDGLRRAREAVIAALARQPLDADAVAAAFAELRLRSRDLQAALHEVVSDVAGRLGPADRTHMARGLFLFTHLPGEDRVALHDVPLM